jgi:hypothetical protein
VSERLLARRRRTLLQRYAGKLSFSCPQTASFRVFCAIFNFFFLHLCCITQFCSSYGKNEFVRRECSGADSRYVGAPE